MRRGHASRWGLPILLLALTLIPIGTDADTWKIASVDMVARLVATPGGILLAKVEAVSPAKGVSASEGLAKAAGSLDEGWQELKVSPLRWLRVQPGSPSGTAGHLVVRYLLTEGEREVRARAGQPFAATARCTAVVFLSAGTGPTGEQLQAKTKPYSLLVQNRTDSRLEARLRGVVSMSVEDLVATITQTDLGVPSPPGPED